jgi:hypothetical protein
MIVNKSLGINLIIFSMLGKSMLFSRLPGVRSLFSNHKIDSNFQIRVITDIDDTIKSSGGVRLFGIALGGIDVSILIL